MLPIIKIFLLDFDPQDFFLIIIIYSDYKKRELQNITQMSGSKFNWVKGIF